MDLLEFISERNCVNRLISYLEKKRIATRNTIEKQTSACKDWQLIIMVFDVLQQVKPALFSDLSSFCQNTSLATTVMDPVTYRDVDFMNKLIYTIKTDQSRPLFRLIRYNNPTVVPMQPINGVEDLPNKKGVYPMCLYIDPERYQELGRRSESRGFDNLINHYFTIIYDGTQYFLNSSYGSDYVCIPQQTVPILPTDFSDLCRLVSMEPTDRSPEQQSQLAAFLVTYFFMNGIRTKVDQDTAKSNPSVAFDWIEPNQGRDVEIAQIYNKYRYAYSVGWMNTYSYEIQQTIHKITNQDASSEGKKKSRRKRSRRSKPYRTVGKKWYR